MNAILFGLMVAVFCAWVLSLPVFPSNDGPAHKFYAGVLGAELFGDRYGDAFRMRFPVPPYASQDYILALASRVMDINLGEKLFVCLVIAGTAFAVRFCCVQMGPSGAWASLFVMPLLLNWALVMGYMNYCLALALMLFCFGLWIRASSGLTSPLILGLFVASAALLTFSHPVPLLMLFLLCSYDLLARLGYARVHGQPRPIALRLQCSALVFLACALVYPVLFTDRSRTSDDIRRTLFRIRDFGSDLLLHGLSPYYRHSRDLFVNLYRLELYVLLAGALLFGIRGLRKRRGGNLGRADFMLLAGVMLYVAIPLMPNKLNGAIDFSLRMLVMVWFFGLFAASGNALDLRGRRTATAVAVIFAALALLPAELNLRPVARQLGAIDRLPVLRNAHGLLLRLNGDSRKMGGAPHNLEVDPYVWSSLVPMLNAHDIPINGAWLDATYLALAPGTDPKLLYNILGTEKEREDQEHQVGDISLLTPEQQRRTLAAADFVFAVRYGNEYRDLTSQLGPAGDQFRCTTQEWYLLCFPKAAK